MGICYVFRLVPIWNRASGARKVARLRVGYARVSTARQSLAAQLDSLAAARCDLAYADTARGTHRRRPGLNAALSSLWPGDQLVVWRLDRLARTTVHLLEIGEFLGKLGATFRVLHGRMRLVDFSNPEDRYVLTVIGAFAQLERELGEVRTQHAIGPRPVPPAAHQYELFSLPRDRDAARPFSHAATSRQGGATAD